MVALAELEELDRYSTNIEDAGLEDRKSLKKLRLLEWGNCPKVTAKGIEALQKELPNLKIER